MSRRRSNKRGRFRPGHAADNGQKAGTSSDSKSSESNSNSGSGSGSGH
jgi:hypothetical protein